MFDAIVKWQARKRLSSKNPDVVASEIFSILGDVLPFDNPDELVNHKGAKVYRDMVNGDAEIRGTLKEIVYSVLGVKWEIQSSDEEDPKAIEQADFIRNNLSNLGGYNDAGLSIQSFHEFLYELVMESMTSGYGVWDRVPRMAEENRVELHVLKGKPPTDYGFAADVYGNLTGLEFTSHGQIVRIDPGAFVIFPWLNFYANWYGTSELRCLYGYYALNKIIIKMAGIFSAKLAGGVWKAQYPQGRNDMRDLLKAVVKAASSTGVLIYPEGVTVEIDKLASGEGDVFNKLSEWLTKKIRRGLIGVTTTAESGRTGDSAGQESRDISVKQPMIQFISDAVVDVVNKQIIKPLIDINWLPGNRFYPVMQFEPRASQNTKENTEIGVMLWNIGWKMSETYAVEKCGYIVPKEGENTVDITQIAALKGAGGSGEATPAQLPDSIGSIVQTQMGEKRKFDPKQYWAGLDSIEKEYGTLIRAEVTRIGEWMLKKLEQNYEKWKTERNGINDLNLPYLGKIESIWKRMARVQWRFGNVTAEEQIKNAIARFADPEDLGMRGFNHEIPDDYADTVGTHWGKKFTGTMSSAFTDAFLAGYDASDSYDKMRDRFSKQWEKYGGVGDEPKWWQYNRMQRNTESTLYNTARFDKGQKAGSVAGYRYIAEMDDRTTDLCQGLNGARWPKGDPRISIYYPPNHHQCRSMMDYIFAWEIPKQWTDFPDADSLQPHPDFGG